MKLCRFGARGAETIGVVTEVGRRIDVSDFGSDYDEAFFASDGVERLTAWLGENAASCETVSETERHAEPIARPSKIVCVGANYAKHAQEAGLEVPSEPMLFSKSTTALCGPYDDVMIPKGATRVDWEVELGFVIGTTARYVEVANAFEHIAGYVLINDVSERAYQMESSGQWIKGKSADTFAPLGPFLATRDEISDPHSLDLWLKVNGDYMQNSNTDDLIRGVDEILSMISRYFTLLPGDIVATGTPAGVGFGMRPPRYLQVGDVMELGVQGLGVARQKVVAFG